MVCKPSKPRRHLAILEAHPLQCMSTFNTNVVGFEDGVSSFFFPLSFSPSCAHDHSSSSASAIQKECLINTNNIHLTMRERKKKGETNYGLVNIGVWTLEGWLDFNLTYVNNIGKTQFCWTTFFLFCSLWIDIVIFMRKRLKLYICPRFQIRKKYILWFAEDDLYLTLLRSTSMDLILRIVYLCVLA